MECDDENVDSAGAADRDGPELLLVRCRLGGTGPLGVLVVRRPRVWPIWEAWLRRLGPDNWLAWWEPLPATTPSPPVRWPTADEPRREVTGPRDMLGERVDR